MSKSLNSWVECLTFMTGKNCKISEHHEPDEDGHKAYHIKIECEGKEFLLGIDYQDVDMTIILNKE